MQVETVFAGSNTGYVYLEGGAVLGLGYADGSYLLADTGFRDFVDVDHALLSNGDRSNECSQRRRAEHRLGGCSHEGLHRNRLGKSWRCASTKSGNVSRRAWFL